MFNIVKENELLKTENVTILIYGEPSAGKTSTANTANNVLCLDFDKGSHRSEFRQNVMVIKSWAEIQDNLNAFFKLVIDYDTIVIDTADSMLEYMGAYAISKDSRLAGNKLRWYGAIKDIFSTFVGACKTLQKDIIFIAHVKEKDEGDNRVKRPAIMGGSYDKVLQMCDFVGFASFKGTDRTLNFNPSEYHIGKNSAKLELIKVPDFTNNRRWFASQIELMKNSLNALNESQLATLNTIKEYMTDIENAENLGNLNAIIEALKTETQMIKSQTWGALESKATVLNCTFNKKSKEFELCE